MSDQNTCDCWMSGNESRQHCERCNPPEPKAAVSDYDNERDEILALYYAAQVAFDHGDDVNQALLYGEASERNDRWQASAAVKLPCVSSTSDKTGCDSENAESESQGAAVKPVQNTAPLDGGTTQNTRVSASVVFDRTSRDGLGDSCDGGVPKCIVCNGNGWIRESLREVSKCSECKGSGVASTGNTEERQTAWNAEAREIGVRHASAYSAASVVNGGQLIEDMHAAFMDLMRLRAKHQAASPSSPLSESEVVDVAARAFIMQWCGLKHVTGADVRLFLNSNHEPSPSLRALFSAIAPYLSDHIPDAGKMVDASAEKARVDGLKELCQLRELATAILTRAFPVLLPIGHYAIEESALMELRDMLASLAAFEKGV